MTTKTFKTGKTWGIGSRKYAISDPSATIALKYGPNVSKGIQEMERCIVVLENANKQKAEEIKRMRVICDKYHLV